jgi:hypothetical protein
MSQPLLEKARKRKNTKAQRAAVILACVVPFLLAAIALPALMSGGEEEPLAPLVHTGVTPTPVNVQTDAELNTDDVDVVDPNIIVTSEDGDLAVDLALDDTNYASGEPVRGVVQVTNHMLGDVHVPAAGEPNAALTIVVLDHDGMEMRRVTETGAEPLPRKTVLLKSGTRVELPVTILARGEDPLPAGTFSAHVEFDADPVWKRLGLPVWTAPNGIVRSYPIFFTVAAAVE